MFGHRSKDPSKKGTVKFQVYNIYSSGLVYLFFGGSCLLFLFFPLVYCLASLAVWWLFGFSGFRGFCGFWRFWLLCLSGFCGFLVAPVTFGFSGLCGFASVASSCIRVQVSRGPEYGWKAGENTRGEQETICNLEKLVASSAALTSSRLAVLPPQPPPIPL